MGKLEHTEGNYLSTFKYTMSTLPMKILVGMFSAQNPQKFSASLAIIVTQSDP